MLKRTILAALLAAGAAGSAAAATGTCWVDPQRDGVYCVPADKYRPPLQFGSVAELARAGWTVTDIAPDLSVSPTALRLTVVLRPRRRFLRQVPPP